MVQINSVAVPYFIGKCSEHNKIKEALLQLIEQSGGENSRSDAADISLTDYFLKANNSEFEQKYVSLIQPYFIEHLTACNVIKSNEEQKYFYWFNQYTRLKYHGWHDHQGVKWASVYYLELHEDNPTTEFRNFVTQEIIKVDVKEGDIITFPGFIDHRSSPNLSNKRKTIIACNLNTIY
jgi:hypothetical protein